MKHVINSFGYEYWFDDKNNYHRTDGGPAIIYSTGNESWRHRHKRYRENNPAYISVNGKQEWWMSGEIKW